ncbi:hypothetical protein EDB87DRAFT_619021 [Lactarius vividus]|nr:hypothetical protein EDB87DRAFT_619021 [Lactarius vividus]
MELGQLAQMRRRMGNKNDPIRSASVCTYVSSIDFKSARALADNFPLESSLAAWWESCRPCGKLKQHCNAARQIHATIQLPHITKEHQLGKWGNGSSLRLLTFSCRTVAPSTPATSNCATGTNQSAVLHIKRHLLFATGSQGPSRAWDGSWPKTDAGTESRAARWVSPSPSPSLCFLVPQGLGPQIRNSWFTGFSLYRLDTSENYIDI